MKILLLSEGRTGSYSVMEWIQVDLKLKIIGETTPYDYINNDDIIVKISLSNDDFDLDYVKYFDKVIILYREDTLSQAESSLWAIQKKTWHHSSDKLDAFYETDDNYLISNHYEIWDIKYRLDKTLKQYKSLDFGLHITYEDIFENKNKNIQKKIEEYIGFVATTTLAISSNKLRIYNPRQTLSSLIREMGRMHSVLEDKNYEIGNLYREIDELKLIVKKNNNKLI
jgi:hypothetical protein